MLYKNDEPYKLSAAEHGKLARMFPKLKGTASKAGMPLKLVYPKSRIKASRSAHNLKPDKPASIAFPLVATRRTDTGTEQWRYADNRVHGTNGSFVYSPVMLTFTGNKVLEQSDIELIYWLTEICPWLEGGTNWNGRTPKCVIENLIAEADVKAEKQRVLADLKALIYSDVVGLKEDKLRLVSKAYFIRNVDDMSLAQVQLSLEFEVMRDKTKGIANFLELVDAEQVLIVKSNIQVAIDNRIISFVKNQNTWSWVTEQGKKNEEIVKTIPTAEPNEALFDYYNGNQAFAEQLTAALKAAKLYTGKDENEE
jgi:hypothetical protein